MRACGRWGDPPGLLGPRRWRSEEVKRGGEEEGEAAAVGRGGEGWGEGVVEPGAEGPRARVVVRAATVAPRVVVEA